MWRLRWAIKQLFNFSGRAALAEVLENPALYKKAILLKLIPGLYRSPISFRLRQGGEFRVREFMTLFIFREIFVDRCYDVPLQSEGEGEPVIIDVGANTGLFALRARQLLPRARIDCYEPYPPNYEELRVTVDSSRMSGVETFSEGVGGERRTAVLHIHPRNVGGHSILDSSASGSQVTIVLVDLATVLDRTPRGTCDLLKLDCEGAEHEILHSINTELSRRIRRIVYEDTPGFDAKALRDHLVSHGYEVRPCGELVLATRRAHP